MSEVWIPGKEFKQSLELSIERLQIPIGEEHEVVVTRSSSGWVKTKKRIWLRSGYFLSKPPEVEDDVSLNVTFHVTPVDNVQFGVSDRGHRTIKFEKGGEYKLYAYSSLWKKPGIESNELILEVA